MLDKGLAIDTTYSDRRKILPNYRLCFKGGEEYMANYKAINYERSGSIFTKNGYGWSLERCCFCGGKKDLVHNYGGRLNMCYCEGVVGHTIFSSSERFREMSAQEQDYPLV